ncbi:MAG: hypothetical protein IJH32_09580 [Ruminococcus sp.]|nr:hypothetical protein [Ruminococcus sp.]
MKMKKVFGNNIVPSCSYCEFSQTEGEKQYCTKNGTLRNGKCRKFRYNPIMRTPHTMAPLQQFDQESFTI